MRRGDLNVYVTDLAAAERFYGEAFGFSLVDGDDTHRTLGVGEVTITLFAAKGGPAPTRGTVPVMTADLLVDDLDATVAAVEAAGGVIESVADWEHGRFAIVTDPDGIGWELIEKVD